MLDRDFARLRRVLELVVVTPDGDKVPAILFDLADYVSAVHVYYDTHMPRARQVFMCIKYTYFFDTV
ncbi:MAG TPA: hypothetical protein VLX09_24215 [Stellaceae bacterium]|nr:hypothetical protein [Stellaceae bacterium]